MAIRARAACTSSSSGGAPEVAWFAFAPALGGGRVDRGGDFTASVPSRRGGDHTDWLAFASDLGGGPVGRARDFEGAVLSRRGGDLGGTLPPGGGCFRSGAGGGGIPEAPLRAEGPDDGAFRG